MLLVRRWRQFWGDNYNSGVFGVANSAVFRIFFKIKCGKGENREDSKGESCNVSGLIV